MYYFGLSPIKKPFIALEIEIRTLPSRKDPSLVAFSPTTLRGWALAAWESGGLPVIGVPAEEWDAMERHGMKLLCPGGHGLQTVTAVRGADAAQAYTLRCGCERGRRIGEPRAENGAEIGTASANSIGGEPEPAEGKEPADAEPAGQAAGDGWGRPIREVVRKTEGGRRWAKQQPWKQDCRQARRPSGRLWGSKRYFRHRAAGDGAGR